MPPPLENTWAQDRFERSHPELDALHRGRKHRNLLAKLPAVELAPDETLVVEAGDFLLAAEGQFLLTPAEGDERTARAPMVVGLLESALGAPTDITVRAMKPTRGHLLSAEALADLRARDPWLRAYERALLAHELRRVAGELRAARQHAEGFYMPGTAALLPGPYFMNDADMVVLVLESKEPGWARRELPPGVIVPPGVGHRFLVVLAHFGEVTCEHAAAKTVRFDYQETTVFLPCIAKGRPGAFTPILFPDSLMAITLGREVYGFPKRFGKTVLDLEHRYAELEVDERLAFWCSWGEPEEVPAERFAERLVEVLLGDTHLADKLGDLTGLWYQTLFGPDAHDTFPPVSAFVRHVVPDVSFAGEQGVVPAQDELVRIPFGVGDVKSFHLLPEAKLERLHADFLPDCEVLMGASVNLDMYFGVKQVLADYVGPLDTARLTARGLRRTARRYLDVGKGIAAHLKRR